MVRKALVVFLSLVLLVVILHLALHRPTDNPYLIAHRGAAGLALENTLPAIRAGVRSGAARIEIDVQRTTDGVLILYHDKRLEGRPIGEHTYGDLLRLRQSEPIPTLDEALALFAEESGAETRLILEGKDPSKYPGIAGEILAALDARDLRARVVVASFDQDWLREFHTLAPDVALQSIHFYPLIVPRIEGVESVALNWSGALLDPTIVRRIHGKGYDAVIWTTDQPALARLLFWLGVDGVATNRPDRLQPVAE